MRFVHLSDLHFGKHDPEVVAGLVEEITSQSPELVVVSGDFTQIGSRKEFAKAREFLDTLPVPVFGVPGNHDVPERNLLKRFLNPYGHYKRFIAPELEPFADYGEVAFAGLRTTRRANFSLNWSDGAISKDQLEMLEQRFSKVAPHAVKVVVAHHPLMHPEEPMARHQRLARRADLALETFARIGVRLVLSGHFHLAYVRQHGKTPGEIAENAPIGVRKAAVAPILVAQAASSTSTRLRGEPNAYNVIDIAGGEIEINVREWGEQGWVTRQKTKEKVA